MALAADPRVEAEKIERLDPADRLPRLQEILGMKTNSATILDWRARFVTEVVNLLGRWPGQP